MPTKRFQPAHDRHKLSLVPLISRYLDSWLGFHFHFATPAGMKCVAQLKTDAMQTAK